MTQFLSWFMLILVLWILIGVAFITLLERKLLSYSQFRKGPNKVSFLGIFQPMADAIKLFSAEMYYFVGSSSFFFFSSPVVSLGISLSIWVIYPFSQNYYCNDYSFFYMFVIMTIGIYPLLMSGLSSSNVYTTLGAYRGISQMISYEVVMILCLMMFFFLMKKMSILSLMKFNHYLYLILIMPMLFFVWLLSALAESNRTPFDFSEGESELVSGFNTEYGSWWFAYIFMGEYSSIMFLSLITSVFICYYNSMKMFLMMMIFIFFWFGSRSAYPRHRFDKLMNLCWKSLIPLLLIVLIMNCFYILF